MVAVEAPALVPIRCTGTTKQGEPCNKILLEVQPEHKKMVLARIQIKCHHCGQMQ